ncbi:cysteine peptidase family C39 domain-containing protein [Sphingomonas sp. Ant20]|uniref:cysteine peptidase family C39 domain-containing protein n=1 Tax=Sphingomonas sp. Ant20 TaxID=104605 RepID=UPI0027421CD9|nr:cysteine peptidase family C39 domain-containing protein [Sphingomonas sp. Ant20]
MVASYHGLNIDMAVMRRRFVPSTRGASLRSLMTIADRLGLTSRAVKVEMNDLGALALPTILHWNMNHYVVLERLSNRKALIHDPAGKSGWIRLSEVSKFFTGVALEVEPTSEFEKGDVHQHLRLSKLWTRIRGLKRAVSQVILLSLVIQIFALVSPYYIQLAIDSALPELNISFLSVLALGFGLFTVLNGVAILLRSTVLLAVGSSFGYGLSSNVARKLFRLPTEWFSRRQVGDILSRFQSVIPIRKMLAEDAPATLVDGALAGLTLVLMFAYSAVFSFGRADRVDDIRID